MVPNSRISSISRQESNPHLNSFKDSLRMTEDIKKELTPANIKEEENFAVDNQEKAAEEEEELSHAEILDLFQEGLAMIVQDPLLCDLPVQVTLEEINSQVALEYGQAMTVKVKKGDGEIMPVVVIQNDTVLDLKKAIQRYVQLKQEREGGTQYISWKYIWRTYHLTFNGEKLTDDKMKLKDYGIRNRDEVTFIKKLRKK
ncbi:U11/U12 small nuclear ribonucleoprotein 25 kDa protein isoform X1 [Chiloscyllium punctatum]|uniref:U11/U12 small nuclear ribonucleoprotein 25 kDa protein isoform X1 n=2 Tax=Chiloscyllium TaxID=34767 RepID=UPI003B6319FC